MNFAELIRQQAAELDARAGDSGLDVARNLGALADGVETLQKSHIALVEQAKKVALMMAGDVSEELHRLASLTGRPLHPSQKASAVYGVTPPNTETREA